VEPSSSVAAPKSFPVAFVCGKSRIEKLNALCYLSEYSTMERNNEYVAIRLLSFGDELVQYTASKRATSALMHTRQSIRSRTRTNRL